MFNNIGGKIKGMAKTGFDIGVLISCVIGIVLIFGGISLDVGPLILFIGILVAALGCLFSWIGTVCLYGFGQLIENSDTIAEQLRQQAAKKMRAALNDEDDDEEE